MNTTEFSTDFCPEDSRPERSNFRNDPTAIPEDISKPHSFLQDQNITPFSQAFELRVASLLLLENGDSCELVRTPVPKYFLDAKYVLDYDSKEFSDNERREIGCKVIEIAMLLADHHLGDSSKYMLLHNGPAVAHRDTHHYHIFILHPYQKKYALIGSAVRTSLPFLRPFFKKLGSLFKS